MKRFLLLSSLALVGAGVITSCGNSGFDASSNITLYSREAGSGTRECFFEGIGYGDVAKEDKWNAGVSVQSAASNGEIMTKVGTDASAVGYCSLDSLKDGEGIKALTFEGVEATEETAVDGSYKLKRNFNYVVRDSADARYTSNEDLKVAKEAFVAYMTESKEGLQTIAANGGIIDSSRITVASAKSWADIAEERFPQLAEIGNVTLLACGSTSVEKVLNGLGSQFKTLTGDKVTVTPNQSGSGDAVTGVTEGKNGTMFDIGFLSREIKDDEKASLGEGNINGAICIDAVVPIVNEANTVLTNITADQLAKIYKGEIKTWSELA